MNNQNEKQGIADNDKLSQELGRAIESMDARLLDIVGGGEIEVEQPGDGGDVYICRSRCA